MDTSFTFYSFLTLVACVLAGAFFSWLLYHTSALENKVKLALAVIRTVTISLLLWLIFSPLLKQTSYILEKPLVIIAQDNSQSIAAVRPADLDLAKYKKDLLQLQKELSAKYQVVTYSFSDQVYKGLDFGYRGKFTNGSALIGQLNNELMNRNVGALILATDGIFNRGGNPGGELSRLKTPVYTIALGDTVPRKDVLIETVNHNDIVFLQDEFKIEVQVRADQCAGEQTTLKVTEDGHMLRKEIVAIKTSPFAKSIPVRIKASRIGMHQYTVSLSSIEKELSLENNTQQFSVQVMDGRTKILIAAAGPHPDLAAIRAAIALDKRHEVSLITAERLSTVDPDRYGLIIMYQLPDLAIPETAFMDKVQAAKIPVWYIVGAQTDLHLFNQFQHGISLSPGNGTLQHDYSDVNSAVSVFDLDQQSKKTIGDFEPLQISLGKVNILGNHQDVLYQRSEKSKTTTPQLFFMNAGGRKIGYLIGEGMWRWKLSEGRDAGKTPVFNALINKVIQYLAVQDDQKKFIVHPAKQSFEENEHILFSAKLYNESYEPVSSADVHLQLKDGKGKAYNYSFSPADSGYQLDAGTLPPGKYNYLASTTMNSRNYTDKGSFFVNTITAEFEQTVADHHLLYQLSEQTNGKMFAPANLLDISAALSSNQNIKTLSYEDRKYEKLINIKFLLVLMLILLSTEWFFRKRNGA